MKLYSDELAQCLPVLCEAYQNEVARGTRAETISATSLELLKTLPDKINRSVRRSNVTIDMFLAITREFDLDSFDTHSIKKCIFDALEQFPFTATERELVRYEGDADFQFRGSDDLMIFVLFNLLKNSLWAIKSSQKGNITITSFQSHKANVLQFTDTALGIDSNDLPYIFEMFFSTKRRAGGTGVGLSYCQQVLKAFGGEIQCQSEKGKYTTFFLEFPPTSLSTILHQELMTSSAA
jgi:signal transduction histidine kinase